MINEGVKNKPLDRYPYMENDLKNGWGVYGKNTVISEDYTSFLRSVRSDIEIVESRLVDAGNFYYLFVKIKFHANYPIDPSVRLFVVDKYLSSIPSRGICDSMYFDTQLGYNGSFYIRKKREVYDLVELSDIDNPDGGLSIQMIWLK